jgi:hypothetical protein
MDDVEPLSLPEDLEPHALVTSLELQASDLLVSATWIRKHTPGIHYLEVSSLKLYDGTVSARRLRSRLEGSDCAHEVSVEYDMPPPGESSEDAARRADRNRRREEKALRNLDSEAAVEHRARKANERQQLRVIEAAVADCLRSLVDMVCEQAVAWEPALGPEHLGPGDWAWIPPAGTSGPELVRIDARYRNGVLDITPLDLGSCDFTCEPKRLSAAEGGKLLTLHERSQRFVGERVRVRYLLNVQGCYFQCGKRVLTTLAKLEPQPFCGPLTLTDLGTDLYAETLYSPSTTHYAAIGGTWPLDMTWSMRGLDGYANGLGDIAVIEALHPLVKVFTKPDSDGVAGWTLGRADVRLFNPISMAYDGVRLAGVPLCNIAGLGFSWPLAEARAGALALALAGVTPSTLDVSLLSRIDTAPDPNAVAAALECSAQERIRARHSISCSLHALRDRVQHQWVQQFVQEGLRAETSIATTRGELVEKAQQMLHQRPGSNWYKSSRHVISSFTSEMLGGECLASVSLLFGDGKPKERRP